MKKLSLLIVVMLILGGILTYNAQIHGVSVMLMIDINPSIKMSLDESNEVVEVKAMNSDGLSLIYDDLVGIQADLAVNLIVERAQEQGFLDVDNLEEDYVMLTTVPMGKSSEKQADKLIVTLKDRIGDSFNVAIIKATKVEMREAEGKKIPVGLYVVNGGITVDGETVSVKEYFSKNDNINKFKEKGTLKEKSNEKRAESIQKNLDRMKKSGLDVSSFESMLINGNIDYKEISAAIRDFMKENKIKPNDKPKDKGKSENKGKP